MSFPPWPAALLLCAGWAVMLLGVPGGTGLLAAGLLLWLLPDVPRQQAQVRAWLGDEPMFPARRPPAEELPRARHRAP